MTNCTLAGKVNCATCQLTSLNNGVVRCTSCKIGFYLNTAAHTC